MRLMIRKQIKAMRKLRSKQACSHASPTFTFIAISILLASDATR